MEYKLLFMSCWDFPVYFCGLQPSDTHWAAETESKASTKASSRQELLFLGYKVNSKAPWKGNVIEVNAPHRAQWFTMLLLTKVIKSFSWLMATSPPQGDGKSVADACAVHIFRDITLIWLIYSNKTTVWDNHHIKSLWTNIHPFNHFDDNYSWKRQCWNRKKSSKLYGSYIQLGLSLAFRCI